MDARLAEDGAGAVVGRRYDIDWVRISAVLLLIPFHTARVFNAGEDFYAKHFPESPAVNDFIAAVGPWHMALLFFLAGASSWLAMRHRSGGKYAVERFKRLLVPFVFGVIVLIPPQAYLGMLTNTTRDLGFWEQYRFYWTHATDLNGYDGTWTPGHLWFILFLFVYSLVALPLFLWLRSGTGRRSIGVFARACRVPGVILLPALLLIFGYPLMDDLSGQNPLLFFVIFVLGFVMISDERITAVIDRQWPLMLGFGAALVAARVIAHPWNRDWPDPGGLRFLFDVVVQLGVWLVMLGLMGFGHRYLNRPGRVLRYMSEAAYPFYIFHQTVIVAIAYVVVRWNVGVPLQFVVIAVLATIGSALLYELLVRRWGPIRFLFGMKPRARQDAAPATVSPAETV